MSMTTSLSFDPVAASREIGERYRRYLRTTFYFRDPELRRSFHAALDDWELVKGPYLEATPVYRRGRSVAEVLAEVVGHELDPGFLRAAVGERRLFSHQEEAIRRLAAGRNVVVATGTGSGKTEAYLLPILLHLLREQLPGERPVGVRALILYPMNALANDQRRRLGEFHRILEKDGSPFRFTFGRYTGESPDHARDDYRKARQQLAGRLSGELILREEMRERPPDVLLTNYSMLEYLLLRPKETPLFDDGRGATWRFLVLDEAHQYKGAKGMEIAMLLRRLKQRVREGGQRERFQCIATSASLGGGAGDRDALAGFATGLFGEPFDAEDIIAGETVPTDPPETASFRIDPARLARLAERVRGGDEAGALSVLEDLEVAAGADPRRPLPLATALCAVFSREERSLGLLSRLGGPQDVGSLGHALFDDVAGGERPGLVSALVDVLVRAVDVRSSTPLLSCRYHLFLRGLEGAFLRFHPAREVLLARGSADQAAGQAFEIALCSECGQHYLVGKRTDDRLGEAMRDETDDDFKIEFYRPLEEPGDQQEEGRPARRVQLCTRCGLMGRRSTRPSEPRCGHGATLLVSPEKESEAREDRMRGCSRCGHRGIDPVREVTHGTDGPNAVIATTLHELLPEERRKVLAFADGRQEAAYFPVYLEETYRTIHGRVLVLRALRNIAETGEKEIGLSSLAVEIRELLAAEEVDRSRTGRERLEMAWKLLFRELLSDQRRISLEGVGLVTWFPRLPPDLELPPGLRRPPWSLEDGEARDLVVFLLDTLRTDGAMELETDGAIRVDWDDLNHRSHQSQVEIGGRRFIKAWDGPRTRRVAFLERWLETNRGGGMSREERVTAAQALLREIWEAVSDYRGPPRLLVPVRGGRRAHPAWWRARPIQEGEAFFQCDVCARPQAVSIRGICARYGCPGRLTRIEEDRVATGDHYRVLYERSLPATLTAEEHTAQIEREKAREFQEAFEQGRIHFLSCSTTFELGIDLGDLDTIFLRNAPPEPFNYAQRVGRAGRRQQPGFAVTYCRRRPHDQATFDDPARLMAGRARPPILDITNVKIVTRHMVAVALATFFRRHPERFEHYLEGFLGDMRSPSVLEDLARFLCDHRLEIEERLDAIIPAGPLRRETGLEDGAWIDKVTGQDTRLDRAVAEVAHDFRSVEALQKHCVENEDFRRAAWTKRRKATIVGEDVISFLSRKAVIPKYGFPVDVVELDLHRAGRDSHASSVSLQRDLSIAVAEFAPEGQVVANKRLWTSRGLKRVAGKEWGRYAYRKCKVHGTFETWKEGETPSEDACCEGARTGSWVDPVFGFVAGRDGGAVPKGRPRRLLTSRPYFSRLERPDAEPALLGGVARVWRASPGRLVVLCEGPRSRGFRICPACGAGFSGTALPGEHESPSGGPCRGVPESVVLGHEFVTDVVRIDFVRKPADVAPADRVWFHYALGYALLHGAAEVLEVPRQDLSVTVRAPADEIVLYDAVPGGAGLVARLEDPPVFREALVAARSRVADCRGCGPDASCYGCLRHYGNQFAHPRLQRGPAARFLTETLEAW